MGKALALFVQCVFCKEFYLKINLYDHIRESHGGNQ